MFSLPSGIKIYIATQKIDMRKSFDSLAMIVEQELKHDIFSGQLFVFINRRGDKIKVLYWDQNGYAMWYKRLERGVFRLPRVNGKVFKVTTHELSLILEGIDLTDKSRLRYPLTMRL